MTCTRREEFSSCTICQCVLGSLIKTSSRVSPAASVICCIEDCVIPEKILIINKRGDFANLVTTYLNTNSENVICGNHHDKVENIPAVDDDGNPIYYKSGPKKGERRYMAAQAQKTYNEKAFNTGKLNVLSVNNSPDKDLFIDVDVIIITSPQCESLKNYMYRLSNVSFNRNKLKLYTLYIKNSIEEKMLTNKERTRHHIILNNCKNNDDNVQNYDFVVAD